jgi:hypothetical protein
MAQLLSANLDWLLRSRVAWHFEVASSRRGRYEPMIANIISTSVVGSGIEADSDWMEGDTAPLFRGSSEG